jgi:hypothetical protein
MKLLINTQFMENYGHHDWDGVGQCPQHWKFKGGEDYFYAMGDYEYDIPKLVEALRSKIEWDEDYSRQYIVGYEVVADDYLTEFEQSQLDYEGKITYPATEIRLVDSLVD